MFLKECSRHLEEKGRCNKLEPTSVLSAPAPTPLLQPLCDLRECDFGLLLHLRPGLVTPHHKPEGHDFDL